MNVFQIALAIAAVLTGLISAGRPRMWLWILFGALSFTISTAWARYDLPYPAAFTAMCDAAVCLAIYFFGRTQWEMHLYRLFQCSVLLSIGYLAGVIGPHYAYVVGLEAINWLALLLINLAVVTSWLGYEDDAYRHPHRSFYWAFGALHAKRTTPPFLQR